MIKLPCGSIKADGWLKSWLKAAADRLKSAYADVRESAWTGGAGDAWDLTPLFLYAAETVAAVTEDAELKKLADGIFSEMVSAQTRQGDFGVKAHREWYPRVYAVRAALKHFEISRDKNDLKFLRDFFKFVYNEFDSVPLRFGARLNVAEMIPAIRAVAEAFPEPFLTELTEKLEGASFDFETLFGSLERRKPLPDVMPAGKYNRSVKKFNAAKEKLRVQKHAELSMKESKLKDLDKFEAVYEDFLLYGGAGIADGLRYLFSDSEIKNKSVCKLLDNVLEKLNERHGNALGIPSSDPAFAGNTAVAGLSAESAAKWTEAFAAAFDACGQLRQCDRIETLVFNAIAAAFADGFSLFQSYQQPNQISIGKNAGGFYFGQGNAFRKTELTDGAPAAVSVAAAFTERLCYTAKNALAFPMYAPCRINAELGSIKYKITETTDYPFKNSVKFTFDAMTGSSVIKLYFRVPTGTYLKIYSGGEIVVEGEKGILEVKLRPKPADELELAFSVPLTVSDNPDGSVSFSLGTLLLASDVGEKNSRPYA
ncbi:MAG: glycoside hydrolase family 127 protein, partial [Clostridiales bacterium]|nr:glycoside hydrolase family 127 protein [Clostridiales bacterium]